MRATRLITSVLLCFLCFPEAHAQLGGRGIGEAGAWGRYHRHYWNSYVKARDNGKKLDYWLRNEVGFGMIFSNTKFNIHRRDEDKDANYYFDTSIKMDIKSKHAFSIYGGTGLRLSKAGDDGAIVFTYGVEAHLTRYDIDPIKLGNYTTNFIFSNMDLGVPLGIDYKTGGEALLDKSKRFCFALGGGIEPIWIQGQMNLQYTSGSVRMAPFLKMEVGYLTNFAGFKLRAGYIAGKYTHFEADDVLNGSQVKLANNGGQFILSLVIMDMVGQWEEQ